MDTQAVGTSIGWIWLVVLIGGPALLGLVYATGIMRSGKQAPQRPLRPGETDIDSTGFPHRMEASGAGEAPVSPPGAAPPR